MPTHVALLRGINVGSHNRIAMPGLRKVVSSLGHTDVATYIQSGNVVFSAQDSGTEAMAGELEEAIAAALGVRPAVIVVSRDELRQVVEGNPFPGEPDPKRVHVVFFRAAPRADAAAGIAEAGRRAREKGGKDSTKLAGKALYLHTPDGFGRSELAGLLLGRRGPAAAGTARNWSTVTKLLSMCEDETSAL